MNMKICFPTLVLVISKTAFAQVADWEPCTASADCSSATSCCTGLYSDGARFECAPLDETLNPSENGCVEATLVSTKWSCFQKDPIIFMGYVDIWWGHEASDGSWACDEWIRNCNGNCHAIKMETGEVPRKTQETLYPTSDGTYWDVTFSPAPSKGYYAPPSPPSPANPGTYYTPSPSTKITSPPSISEQGGSGGMWAGVAIAILVGGACVVYVTIKVQLCNIEKFNFICFDCRRRGEDDSARNLASMKDNIPTQPVQGTVIDSSE